MANTTEVLSKEEVAEMRERFPFADYNPDAAVADVITCEFCNGAIDDHKPGCEAPLFARIAASHERLRELLERICWAYENDASSAVGQAIEEAAVALKGES